MKRYNSRQLSRQLRILSIAIILVCGAIFGVLVYFQIYRGADFNRTSEKNCLRRKTVTSIRGAILDRHGKALATNRPVTALVWQGSGKRRFNENQIATIKRLQTILGNDAPDEETLLTFEKQGQECIICADLPFERLSCIMEQCSGSENLVVKTASMRFYPYGTIGCHVIGYFRGMSANQGTLGLERMYEEQLRGEPGECAVVVNAIGQNLELRNIKEARDGSELQTTLDFDIQSIAEGIFTEEQVGALVAMDPRDGSILAVVSRPAFDPNIFVGPVDATTWKKCMETKPFINRAFCASYPPASLFKLVTSTAALEEGIATPQSHWHCTGSIMFGNYEYHCNKDKIGHGNISFEEAIAQSCNIAFYDIGKRINIDRLAHYAHLYGLGSPTGVSLPEKSGLIPTSAWKKKYLHEPWWQGETLQVCIGQTYVMVTPLQIARMISSIFTGTLVTPRILAQEPIIQRDLAISIETRKFIQKAMKSAIVHGTGKILNQIKDIKFYGKTGTAQTHHRSKHKLGGKFLPHGWFACHAQYKDYEPIVLVIMVEHAGSSSVCATMAKNFFVKYCKIMDGEPLTSEAATPKQKSTQEESEAAQQTEAVKQQNSETENYTTQNSVPAEQPIQIED